MMTQSDLLDSRAAFLVPVGKYKGRPIAEILGAEETPYTYWILSQRGMWARHPGFCQELERLLGKYLRERAPIRQREGAERRLQVIPATELLRDPNDACDLV